MCRICIVYINGRCIETLLSTHKLVAGSFLSRKAVTKIISLMLAIVALLQSKSTAAFVFGRSISSSVARAAPILRSLSMSSKKRPGVAASVRLSSIQDVYIWERVEAQYDAIRNDKLVAAEKACQTSNVSDNDSTKFDVISKDQLMDIVQWKFAVGKPRPQNLGLLRGNTDAQVRACSKDAIHLANNLSISDCISVNGGLTGVGKQGIKQALEALTNLRGVGPATATAVLYRVRPDLMCYMYDEVIDCFETKRDYTMNIYLRINDKCLELATVLGDDWTTARVANVLWIAARVLADGGNDLTAFASSTSNKKNSEESTVSEESGRKKRKTKR